MGVRLAALQGRSRGQARKSANVTIALENIIKINISIIASSIEDVADQTPSTQQNVQNPTETCHFPTVPLALT